ncbi:unnamed protein product [Adineta ricciae]|uniref:F-box domain-containing protein n=1 Tax=Adineta ricciae TaxID=249248 RepID=A0A814KQ54_ADIRI|nr:unnamed protein product [Adineta ricciae]CAF1054010.1 unnamed protein product [Adineta ricciae]
MAKLETLPNEILCEVFQFITTPQLFHAFDNLNNRFAYLIRNVPLHVEFSRVTKSSHDVFCRLIASDAEMKKNIISLRLSNDETVGRIEDFVSVISLNHLDNLRSLTLDQVDEAGVQVLLPMLRSLSKLCYFSFLRKTELESDCIQSGFGAPAPQPLDFKSILSSKHLRTLSLPYFICNPISIHEALNVTSATLFYACTNDVLQLFISAPLLKHFRARKLSKPCMQSDAPTNVDVNAVHLKDFLLDWCDVECDELEFLLKRIPNLKTLSLSSYYDVDEPVAYFWQKLIESSLEHLRVFNFCFQFHCKRDSSDGLHLFNGFQNDFWHEQHHWYTNYTIRRGYSGAIYTIPYSRSEYYLDLPIDLEDSVLSNDPSTFNNVKRLSIRNQQITDNLPYYFQNVQSLILSKEWYVDKYEFSYVKFLSSIVNTSNVTCLELRPDYFTAQSEFLDLFKILPHLSSLHVHRKHLNKFYDDINLCQYLKGLYIKKLDIFVTSYRPSFAPDRIDIKTCQLFPYLEELCCTYVDQVDVLLLALQEWSKLSYLKTKRISKDITSWIEENASTLKIRIDFESIVSDLAEVQMMIMLSDPNPDSE